MIPTLTFEGGQDLQKALEQLPAKVSKRFQFEALFHAAEPIKRQYERTAPADDEAPHAKDTIVIRRVRGVDAQESAVAVGPSKAGWYLSFQELGTAHHAPQPDLRQAFDANQAQALQRLAADIWASLASRGVMRSRTVEAAVMGEEV